MKISGFAVVSLRGAWYFDHMQPGMGDGCNSWWLIMLIFPGTALFFFSRLPLDEDQNLQNNRHFRDTRPQPQILYKPKTRTKTLNPRPKIPNPKPKTPEAYFGPRLTCSPRDSLNSTSFERNSVSKVLPRSARTKRSSFFRAEQKPIRRNCAIFTEAFLCLAFYFAVFAGKDRARV